MAYDTYDTEDQEFRRQTLRQQLDPNMPLDENTGRTISNGGFITHKPEAPQAAPSQPSGSRDEALQRIQSAYQSHLGRAATQAELDSEVENYGKYGASGLDYSLSQRAGDPERAKEGASQYSGSGGGGADNNLSQFLDYMRSRDATEQAR